MSDTTRIEQGRLRGGARRVALTSAFGLLAAVGSAQDTHYWNLQYGPVAELLGGVVVGSAIDLSSTYYNPGGLSLAEDPAFLLSLNSFQLEQLTVDDSGEVFDLSSSRFSGAPSLIAFAIPGFGEDTRMAFTLLTRQEFKLRIQQRAVGDLPAGRAGAENLADQDASEYWGGFTVSRRISDRVGVGGTLYGVYRKQRIRTEVSGQLDSGANAGLTLLSVDEIRYDHARLLGKLGLALDFSPLQLGIAWTSPSLGVFGTGEAGYTRSLMVLSGSGGENLLANAFAEGLATDYHSPASVAVGASYQLPRSRIHFSAEWFDAVDRFDAVDTTPFLDEAEPAFIASLRQQLASVLNVGIGGEFDLGRDLKLYGAFATDFSAAVRDEAVDHTLSTWDIYHFTVGAGFRIGTSRFTVGVSHSRGDDQVRLGIPGQGVDLPLLGTARDGDVHYRRWKFVLGFVFGG